MLFCYFWGHDFFPASRDAVWRLALPPSKGERGTAIIMRFRRGMASGPVYVMNAVY